MNYRHAQEPAADGVHHGTELSLGEIAESLRAGRELPGRYAALAESAGRIVAAVRGEAPTVPSGLAGSGEGLRVRASFQRVQTLHAPCP